MESSPSTQTRARVGDGIGIDVGPASWSPLAAGYEVYAIKPMASARYRDPNATSGANSVPGARSRCRQRQLNALRSSLREYFPRARVALGADLASTDTPGRLDDRPDSQGRRSFRDRTSLRLGHRGCQRKVERRAEEIQEARPGEQLKTPELVPYAHGLITRSALALIATFNTPIA